MERLDRIEARGHAPPAPIGHGDLFGAMGGDEFDGKVSAGGLTHDGLHYTQTGYRALAWQLAKGLGYGAFPSGPLADKLREGIIEKNRLFFHRWRPANETYLFLFRKLDQFRPFYITQLPPLFA